jgi:hypothetical protein
VLHVRQLLVDHGLAGCPRVKEPALQDFDPVSRNPDIQLRTRPSVKDAGNTITVMLPALPWVPICPRRCPDREGTIGIRE